MIFVILGTVVLVASFLIALVSLLKEQNKVGDTDDVSAKPQKSPSVGKSGVKVGPVAVSTTISEPSVDASKPVVGRELFPWEEGKYKAAGPGVEADRAKVEALRSQLAELKKQAGVQNIDRRPLQEEPAVPGQVEPRVEAPLQQEVQIPAEPEEQLIVQKPVQRLTGEVSISDLKGQ